MRVVSLKVEGHVQGVGFRYFTSLIAESHHIKGWVRNTTDGGVEIEAEGEEFNIEAFIKNIKDGPRFSRIDRVTIKELEKPRGYKKFELRY